MKKRIGLLLTCTMLLLSMTGCVGTTVVINECNCPGNEVTGNVTNDSVADENVSDTDSSAADNVADNANQGAAELTDTELKTGLAVVASAGESTSATATEAGAIKYDVTVAAVTVDANGVIRSCSVDGIPATVSVDGTGTITSDIQAEVATKNELGENYGMVAWGGALAEWDAQVAALCDFAVGKTVTELKNGAVDETGKAPAGTDLASSATIYLGGYVNAIEKAVNNAQKLGASVGDEMKLVTLNSLKNSTSATAEAAGNVQLDVDVAVVTLKDGVITSAVIDGLQAKVVVDATGTITSDLATFSTKNELGEKYGMVAWGGAIAEWDAQAASFASYITGKTAEEVAGIAVTEATVPADGSDLSTSVTIAVGGFQALIAKVFH